jgi:hypothetical protein
MQNEGLADRRNSTLIHTRTSTTGPRTTGPIRMMAMLAMAAAALVVAAPIAQAQLGKEIRTSPSPPVPPIQAFIKQQITKLHGSDPKATHDAREALLAESVAPDASAGYLATYARELNAALLEVQKDPDLRVRLNAAIACAKVSDNTLQKLTTGVPPLAPSMMAFMNDGSEAVSLWGLKAARISMPRLLTQGGAEPMIAAVVAAAKKYPSNTTAAYEALASDANPKLLPTIIIPAIQDLLAYRVSLYQKSVPADPAAEIFAANTLVPKTWWTAHTKDQKHKTLQLLLNLAAAAAQRAADPNITSDQREAMAMLVKQAALSFQAIGIHDGVPDLQQMSKQITGFSQRAAAEQIMGAAKSLQEIVLKVHPELTPPPGTATNTRPATSKTSGG